MKTLIAHLPNASDPTSFYRGIGPLAAMRRERPGKLNLAFLKDYNWSSLCLGDLLFAQRPYRADDLAVIKLARDQGLRVWTDYDDDLFGVPTDNPAYRIYGSEQSKATVADCIALSNVVTVSTEALKQKIISVFRDQPQLTPKVLVVPNAFMSNLIAPPEAPEQKRNDLVLWRGSSTHMRDVMSVADRILAVHARRQKTVWRFVGDRLWFLTDYMRHDDTIVSDAMDTIEYFRHIRQIRPKVMVVPLLDHSFNQCKSNIAWIEGSFAGAVVIAPKQLPEFHRPGCLLYDSPEGFEATLEQALDGAYSFEDTALKSWDYIKEHLMVRHANVERWRIVDDEV